MKLSIGRLLARDRLLEINREHQAKLEVELANLRELILDPFAGSFWILSQAPPSGYAPPKTPIVNRSDGTCRSVTADPPRFGSARA